MNNVPLHISKHGKGTPLLLIHGFLANSSIWGEFLSKLSSLYSVFCVELPGHGTNQEDNSWSQLSEIAEKIIQYCNENKIVKPHIVGHSMGGYIALEMLRLQFHFNKLILLHSHPFADSPIKKKQRTREIKLIKEGKSKLVHKLLLQESLQQLEKNNQIILHEASTLVNETMSIRYIQAMLERNSYNKTVENNINSILIIHGDFDIPLNIEAHFPKIKIEQISSGHYSFLDLPEMCIQKIVEFISE